MKLCDLHTHSTFSDGTCTPAQIVEESLQAGLSAVALCDHSTLDGLPAFLAAAEGTALEAVAGAEFSVDYKGVELHLLGLYLPHESFPALRELADFANRKKAESNRKLIASLVEAGYRLDYDTVCQKAPKGNFNRVHVATALTELGAVPDIDTAFATILHPDAGYYNPPVRPDFFSVVTLLRQQGAVPVLAHPFLQLSYAQLEELLPAAKAAGLLGMECLYSAYDDATTAAAIALCEKFSLSPSGGSDFHGDNKPKISLGTGEGNLQIPYTWAQRLKELANP